MKKFNNTVQMIALCIIAFAVYCNTIFNDYALDDKAITYENSVTKNGFSGVKDIFTHYYYYGGINSNTHTYRPLTSLTHAIEWQFFKRNPGVSHFINILLYALSILFLYQLLLLLFEKRFPNSYLPFIASLLFCLHPVHTEVVANIKGRDEILSFLFVLMATYYFIKNFNTQKIKSYFISGTFFFLALLSKESAILFLLFLPLIIYFFTSLNFIKSISKTLPFLIFTLLYALIARSVLGPGTIKDQVVFNVPYIYATTTQAFATKIYVISKYLLLLLFPHPLISDYTYKQIPYIDLQDIRFWISTIVVGTLLVYAISSFKRKNIFSFSILFFFASIALVSNLFISTGVMMAERSIYAGTLSLCIAMAYAVHLLAEKSKSLNKKHFAAVGYIGIFIIATLYSTKVVSRNFDWYNDRSLFTHDVINAPDCVKLLELSAYYDYFSNPKFAAGELPDIATRNVCVQKLKKAIQLLPNTFPEPYAYLSYIYLSYDSVDLALSNIEDARKKGMNTPQINELLSDISKKYESKGDSSYLHHDIENAGNYFKKATDAYNGNARAWWNYGGICHEKGDDKGAIAAWKKVLAIDPSYPKAKEFLSILKSANDSIAR